MNQVRIYAPRIIMSVFANVRLWVVAYRLGSDYVLFLLFVKPGNTFYGHIVRLRCPRSEENILGVSPN